MAVLNDASASITALFKYYHSDRSRFYPAISTATAYADEFFAVTIHTDYITNSNGHTVIRFHRDSDATWLSWGMRDVSDSSAPAAVTGSGTGDLARLGDKIYFSNYDDDVHMAQVRRSAGDSDSDFLWKAGLPDPNATKVISRCDTTANWTYDDGSGTGSASLDRTPSHRLYGDAALQFTQEVSGSTATLTFSITAATGAVMNMDAFDDGSSSSDTDFIAFNVFRFDKNAIKALKIMLSTDNGGGFTNFFYAPLAEADDDSLKDQEESATWAQWDFQQNTSMAQWGINPYDNQFFRVRIRKQTFAMNGSPAGWSAITSVGFAMEADTQASASNPAKITINDLIMLKTPPIAKDYSIQWNSFEEQDPNSSNGWVTSTAPVTKASFNRRLTKEGVSCLIVSGNATTAAVSIEFDTGQDFVTFPDGVTANTACVLSMNCGWLGASKGIATYPIINWGLFTAPRLRFYSGGQEFAGGNYMQCTFGMGASLRGGLLKKKVRFHPDSTTGSWVKQGTGCDWTDITRIDIYGPRYNSSANSTSYYMDDLKLEWPKAQKIVNAFEPLDLIALTAIDQWADTNLKDYAWVADLATDAAEFLLKTTKYKTYGYGHVTYPDFEHSSLGIAGLTVRAYGSKPCGMTIQRDKTAFGGDIGINLDEYKHAVIQMPPVWDWSNDQFGFIKYETIASSLNDKFKIWIAAEKPEMVSEIKIRFHGNDGSGDGDLNNYYEYTITGQELYQALSVGAAQITGTKQLQKIMETEGKLPESAEAVVKGDRILRALRNYDQLSKNDLIWLTNWFTHPYNKQEIQGIFKHSMQYLGKDRGGWPSAIFEWNKKDMILVRSGEAGKTPDWSDIRAQSFEVTATGNEAAVCFDNLTMINQGALSGEFYYKVAVEDKDGYLSNTSEPSDKILVDNKDVQLTDIFVPTTGDQLRVENKKIFRLGGKSTVWRHVGDLAPDKNSFLDRKKEEDLGLVMPADTFGPPRAKVIKAIANTMYYGNCISRLGETFPYRVYRSEPYCGYQVNDFASIDIPETMGKGVTAIEQYYNHVVIWTPDSMWSTTIGLDTPPVFRSEKGCIARRSVAIHDKGLIWLSREGLMIGNISSVDDTFFLPINDIFKTYTEDQLENAIGFIKDNYYYLFYDVTNRKGLCCYLPERLFSELTGTADATGPFDVTSLCLWRGGTDDDKIYYGRSNGEIYTMFDGDTDNGTAIWTHFRTKDFSDPGIMYDKELLAGYLSLAKIGTETPTLTINAVCNQSSVDTMPTITATSTAFRSYVKKAAQGDYGQFIGLEGKGLNRHKIAHLSMKITPKPDNEYFND